MKIDLEKQMANIIREYREAQFNAIQESLTVASNVLVEKLKEASPIGNGPDNFKDQWGIKTKYKNVRYVGNSKMTKATKNFKSIPLSNALEFGSKGKPFIARTYSMNKEEIYNIFKKELGRRIN